jgi:mevalonate kinase
MRSFTSSYCVECKFKRFNYLETLQNNHPELVTDLAELKNDVETGMYFDSSIPQGYGVK